MGAVMFHCHKTQEEFGSGFQAQPGDLKFLPLNATISLRCGVCGEVHEFKFADARINERRRA